MAWSARWRLVGVLLFLLGAVLFLSEMGWYGRPPCYWWSFTGTYCPLCGGERALGSLAGGKVGQALRENALVVAGIPLLLLWVWDGRRRETRFSPKVWVTLFAGVLLFAVLRNLPGLDLLRP